MATLATIGTKAVTVQQLRDEEKNLTTAFHTGHRGEPREERQRILAAEAELLAEIRAYQAQ